MPALRARRVNVFIDESRVFVHGGDGGNGCMSFLREKYRPKGGPDGGNGGSGGDVVFMATEDQNTLARFSSQRHYKAKAGNHGGGVHKHGACAKELIVTVPVGTVVRDDDTGELLADLAVVGDRFLAAKGGKGGKGNAHFACPATPLPRFAEKGEPGEERWVKLELRVMADVGLTGLPNAGKSTFISRITMARPKVAAYPFTTLEPSLGVVKRPDHTSFVVADLPGLIEGAHEGTGLGDRFLKHLHRTRVILHLVDLFENEDPLAAYHSIRNEILKREGVAEKREIIVGTKMDLGDLDERLQALREGLPEAEIFGISSATGRGVEALLHRIDQVLSELPRVVEREVVVAHFTLDEPWTITREGEAWVVRGEGVERLVRMTDLANPHGVDRMHRVIRSMGIFDALEEQGIEEGDTVRIGELEFWHVPDDAPLKKRRKSRRERKGER